MKRPPTTPSIIKAQGGIRPKGNVHIAAHIPARHPARLLVRLESATSDQVSLKKPRRTGTDSWERQAFYNLGVL
ncbi:UNVERIFIED_CONTAM: hypothetical protein Sradi_3796100 [Sesamum radiatum]|uniref:Uncharacterized protein n=1 Tax=Sesamum radiatum TaxID=300843 RepID=A0AAW2Q089_SESRA